MPICGFPGYHVTPSGQVWSTKGKDGSVGKRPARVLKGSLLDGYPRVTLCTDGKRKRLFVHRLVAETFLGPCPDELEVAHLNGDRRESRLANLRYVTRSENHRHKIDHGTMLMGDSHPNRSISEKTARHIGERLRRGRIWNHAGCRFSNRDGPKLAARFPERLYAPGATTAFQRTAR